MPIDLLHCLGVELRPCTFFHHGPIFPIDYVWVFIVHISKFQTGALIIWFLAVGTWCARVQSCWIRSGKRFHSFYYWQSQVDWSVCSWQRLCAFCSLWQWWAIGVGLNLHRFHSVAQRVEYSPNTARFRGLIPTGAAHAENRWSHYTLSRFGWGSAKWHVIERKRRQR